MTAAVHWGYDSGDGGLLQTVLRGRRPTREYMTAETNASISGNGSGDSVTHSTVSWVQAMRPSDMVYERRQAWSTAGQETPDQVVPHRRDCQPLAACHRSARRFHAAPARHRANSHYISAAPGVQREQSGSSSGLAGFQELRSAPKSPRPPSTWSQLRAVARPAVAIGYLVPARRVPAREAAAGES